MKKEYSIYGEFFYEIVDENTRKVVVKSKKKKNLILNQGLDFLSARSFVENVAYCAVGSSTVGPLYTDTGLVGEFARTSTLDTSLQNSATTTLTGNIYSFTRIFRFPTTINPANYGTVGWSYTGTSGNNLFSKSLILTSAGGAGPVFVNNGQYIRIHYTLNITINPSSATSGNSNITGIASDGGSYAAQLIGLKSINSSNVIGYWDAAQDCNELYSQAEVFFSKDSTAPQSFGTSFNRSGSTTYFTKTSNSYLGSGTGIVYKRGSFGKNSAIDTNLRSMGLGLIGASNVSTGFVYVFTSNQTKLQGWAFSPIFIYSVVRM